MLSAFLLLFASMSSAADSDECKEIRSIFADDSLGYMGIESFQRFKETEKLMAKIETQLSIPILPSPPRPWARVLYDLKNGDLDLITTIYKTKDREKRYVFSVPYTEDHLYIFIKKDNQNHPKTIAELVKYRGAGLRNASYGSRIDKHLKLSQQFSRVNGYKQLIHLLLHERIDFFIEEKSSGTLFANQFGAQNHIKALPNPIESVSVYIAISKASPCKQLLNKINAIITAG